MILWAEDEHEAAKVAQWAAMRIPHLGDGGFGPCQAAAIGRQGRTAAVVVFHAWDREPRTLQVSIAADSPLWASRATLAALFRYAFVRAGAEVLWSAMPNDNTRAIKFNTGIGFKREAVLRHRFGPKRHAVITSMTRQEWQRSIYFMGNP